MAVPGEMDSFMTWGNGGKPKVRGAGETKSRKIYI